jgi:hypothetical protein
MGRGQKMRAKIRQILEECIETGMENGWDSIHEHTETPSPYQIFNAMEMYIWDEIDQRFDFERNVCDEVVKGFDQLEKEREWVELENKDRFWVIDEWQQLTRSVKDTEFNKAIRLCKMLEEKLKELNT